MDVAIDRLPVEDDRWDAKDADRRREPRFGHAESIYFTTRKQIYSGNLKNKSRTGLFIEVVEAEHDFAQGEWIIAVVPGAIDGGVACKGRIAWCSRRGLGVKLHI